MRRIWMATFVAMLVGLAGLSCAYAQNPIEALAAAWEERFNAGDAAGLAELHAADGVLRHASAEVDQGRAEIAAWAAENIEAGLQFTVAPERTEFLSETIGYSVGSWSASMPDGTVAAAGEYIAVDVLVDGEWKIHEMFAGTVPMPE